MNHPDPPVPARPLRIGLVGDVMLGRGVNAELRGPLAERPEAVWGDLLPELRACGSPDAGWKAGATSGGGSECRCHSRTGGRPARSSAARCCSTASGMP